MTKAGSNCAGTKRARNLPFGHTFEQVSHGGERAAAVEAGAITRTAVTQLGDVLATAPGRAADNEITLFDSTGLAIQDLVLAEAAFARAGDLDLLRLEL